MIDEKTEKRIQEAMIELTDRLIKKGVSIEDATEYGHLWRLQLLTKLAPSEQERWEVTREKIRPFLGE